MTLFDLNLGCKSCGELFWPETRAAKAASSFSEQTECSESCRQLLKPKIPTPRVVSLLVFDEVCGYVLPRPQQPPTKQPMLLLLKLFGSDHPNLYSSV
jgi:hypothetical protein